MEVESPKVEIFFFPFVGGGHLIPMIDLARLFASHGVKATIITTPNESSVFENSIHRDHKSGLDINFHNLILPLDATLQTLDMSAPPLTDTSVLQEPFKHLLLHRRPDCVVAGTFHRWVADVSDGVGIPRIIFNGNCCFARCCDENIKRFSPHSKVASDLDIFVVPNLPDKIELTRSQLPVFIRTGTEFPGHSGRAESNSFGQVVNSFYDLEPAYVDYYRNVLGKRAWLVGPVSLRNRNLDDKAMRGEKSTIDESSCLNWLGSKKPNSVLYVSFGSLARLSSTQLYEIACGLESAGHPFVWVVGKILDDKGKENCFPRGFEERILGSKMGLIIKGWAPQLLILEHESIGGFMTHCGWNSTLEGICGGVPMITWPLSAEQFYNEKLVTEVLKIGIRVGSREWALWNMERETVVEKEKVEAAIVRLMGGGDKVAEMRRRAELLAKGATRAVEAGGSSFNDVDALINEIKNYRCSR